MFNELRTTERFVLAPRLAGDKSANRTERIAKITLIGVFLTVFGLAAKRKGGDQITTSDLILLVFATLRLGRLIAFERVTEPLRSPFAETVKHPFAGETTEAKGEGWRRALGELVTCPICSGTWAAAGLTYFLKFFPGPARLFLRMTAAIGAAEILNGMIESFGWLSDVARKYSA